MKKKLDFYHSFPEYGIEGRLPIAAQERTWSKINIPDLSGKTVLDIGAWSGWYSVQCEKLGAEVTAIDIHKRSVDNIKYLNSTHGHMINCECVDLLNYDPKYESQFNVVLFLGVLYHMKHPLLGLEKCFSLTRELCIIESHVDDNIGHTTYPELKNASYMRFIPDDSLNNDPTNWWAPSVQCVIDMCKCVGFSRVECINTHHNRGIFHAYK